MRQIQDNDSGLRTSVKVAAGLVLVAIIWFLPAMASAQSRTDWEMHRGGGVLSWDFVDDTDKSTFDVYKTNFDKAQIPSENDPGWTSAPDPKIIGFEERSGIKDRTTCLKEIDYTYFQTTVSVPVNAEVNEFKIKFSGMDDGSRVTIFNSKYRSGVTPGDSYARINDTLQTNLKDYLVKGDNRVVITQLDNCCCGNNLKSAVVELNGETVETKPEPETKPEMPPNCSWGDVHIRTPDGLNYDFQAAGEFVLLRSTDSKVVVQARQEKWHKNPRVTVNTAVAMKVNGDRLAVFLEPSPALHINGKPITLFMGGGLQLANGGSIYLQGTASAPDYLVVWPDGFRAGIQLRGDHINTGVAAPADPKTKYEGLCGNLDGDPNNDYQARGGKVFTSPISFKNLYEDFGLSWSVPEAEISLFVNGSDEHGLDEHGLDEHGSDEHGLDEHGSSTFGGTEITFTPPTGFFSIWDLSVEERRRGEEACKGIQATVLRDNCILDVGTTGSLTFVTSAEAVAQFGLEIEVRGDRLPTSDKKPGFSARFGWLYRFFSSLDLCWIVVIVVVCLLFWRRFVRYRIRRRR